MPAHEVVTADVLEWAAQYQGPLFHALLCDPPYHLTSIVKRFGKEGSAPAQEGSDGRFSRLSRGFMGQEWDGGDVAFRPETWAALGKLLLPGAHLLAFGGTRTWHRLAVAIEDAGFELRDTLLWLYGSGFPKSHDVSKGIDRAQGEQRPVVGEREGPGYAKANVEQGAQGRTHTTFAKYSEEPVTDAAQQWDGYGTALKPAWEPIIVARKPLDGTVAQNCLKHGCGALNIDSARIANPTGESAGGGWGGATTLGAAPGSGGTMGEGFGDKPSERHDQGRWPANVLLSHDPRCRMLGERKVRTGTAMGGLHNASGTNEVYGRMMRKSDQPDHGYADKDGTETVEEWECVEGCPVAMFPEARSSHGGGQSSGKQSSMFGIGDQGWNSHNSQYYDSGSASRFFYTAKADTEERERGLFGVVACMRYGAEGVVHDPDDGSGLTTKRHYLLDDKGEPVRDKAGRIIYADCRRNPHPTVKPLDLLRYLSLLVLPPPLDVPRRLLVPFAGVGSEMIGGRQAGFDEVVGVEWKPEYADIAGVRLRAFLGML